MSGTLWAPWRFEYFARPKATGGQDDCIFCAFPTRKKLREDLVLVVQPHAFVVLNKYPFAAGHLLVVPRKHVSQLEDLTAEEYAALMELVRESVVALKAAVKPNGVNVGFNLGHAAGAGIADHLHAHLVPRWIGDQNFMPVIGDMRIMPQYLEDTWRALMPAFERIPGDREAIG